MTATLFTVFTFVLCSAMIMQGPAVFSQLAMHEDGQNRPLCVSCYPSPFASGEQENTLSIESITQQVKAEISKLTQVLHMLGGTGAKSAKSKAQPKAGRKMSAAGRKKIAAAQRARWAKIRAAKKS
jgi:hypothetical protein